MNQPDPITRIPYVDPRLKFVNAPHPATLVEEELLPHCTLEFGRVGGPGGQHRNRVDTACWIQHTATGIETQASERRSQGQNKGMAIWRLRLKLAVLCRTRTHRDRHACSALWCTRRQGEKMSVNPEHADYPALLAEALDVIVARRYDVAGAAGVLGITMSQLSRLVRHHKHAFGMLNDGRKAVGLVPLRS